MSTTSSMRVFSIVLQAHLLGVELVPSLICSSCTHQKSNINPPWPVACKDTGNYCIMLFSAVGFGNVNLGYTLNTGCSQSCPHENININPGVASVNSYQSSFCNFSNACL
ncbi:mCG1036309 [Mus musculus]|nr:mCG1036309 [Mus musculus]